MNAGFFRTLGVNPALGRAFRKAEDGSSPERLAILSDAWWRSQFAADSNILGHTIVLNSIGYTVIGVLPPDFRFPDQGQPDVYVPGGFSGPAQWNTPRMALLRVVGRLRDGLSIAEAGRELKAINERHSVEIPSPYQRAFRDRLLQIIPLQQRLVGDLRPALLVLWGAVCLLLLLTCSNLAALQLARAFARTGEFAIRLALGGDPKRLVQLLLTENLLLAGIGAVLGIAGAYESVGLTNALPLSNYSLGGAVVLDGRPVLPPGARPTVPILAITPEYLCTVESPILAGRGIEPKDHRGSAMIAIVNHSFAPLLPSLGSHWAALPVGSGWRAMDGDCGYCGGRATSGARCGLRAGDFCAVCSGSG